MPFRTRSVHLQDIFVVQAVVEKGDWWDVVDVSNSRRGLIPSMARYVGASCPHDGRRASPSTRASFPYNLTRHRFSSAASV